MEILSSISLSVVSSLEILYLGVQSINKHPFLAYYTIYPALDSHLESFACNQLLKLGLVR